MINYDISIVIPVFNSENNLFELQKQIHQALHTDFAYEIIFTNDYSSDNSWENICNLIDKNDNICGINLRKNSGQDNAIMAGLRESKGDYVVIMDDDLQHNPADIINLHKKCSEGFDVCYANFKTKKQNILKNTGSWFNGKIAEIVVNKPKDIYLSPFKIIKKEVIDEICRFSGPYPYIDGIILTITHNIVQIDVTHHKRLSGHGNYNLFRSTGVLMKLTTGFSVVPLRIATIVGFLIALAGFCLMIFYLSEYFFTANRVEGWISTITLLLFIGGFILMSLGLIGEYLGRIYLAINNKPQYTIMEKVKNEK